MAISLGTITPHGAMADRKAYSVQVTYAFEGETVYSVNVTFHGPVYGSGPVVVTTDDCPGGCWVARPDRFGATFGPDWIRAFYTDAEEI